MDVSVALCTYNGAEFLEQQLDSILNQSETPSEVVVCDDGSTDGTWQILQTYNDSHPDLFEIEQNDQNLGVTKNFEKAIRLCDGDLIALSDQDDSWNTDKLESQVERITSTNARLVFHNSTIVSEDLEPITDLWTNASYSNDLVETRADCVTELIRRNFVQGATIMFERSLREHAVPIPEIWQHDYYLALVATLTGGIDGIDDTLLKYRQHDGQDLGARGTSFFEVFKQNLRSGGADHHRQQAKKWELLVGNIQQWPADPVVDSSLPQISEKIQYEYRRSNARNPENKRRVRLNNMLQNARDGHYSEYGMGVLSLGKDVVALAGFV